MIRTYRNLPDIVTGYPLDDVWSVVVPIQRTNEVLNPSAETGTTGYTAGTGTLTRSTEQQYHGAYSFKYVPGAAVADGFFYSSIQTTTGELRAISCKFKGQPGVPYIVSMNSGVGIELAAKAFVATGRWQWVYVYWLENAGAARRIYFRKNNSADTHAFYVDGVQSEVIQAGETVSTYIDGSQLGLVPNQQPVAYFWNGTPHASTSTRSSQTRAGGMVVPFSKYRFLITALIGLGLATPQNVATDYARIDGSYDDYTRKPSRQFTITGRFQGRTYGELRRNRSGLAQLFDRDLTGQDQRLTLLRHVEDGDGRIVSTTIRALAKYESGFGGNTDNMHAETVPLTFTLYMPNILADGEDGESLSVQLSVSNANAIIYRSATGTWSALGSGITGGATPAVRAIVRGLNGTIYVGGEYTDAGGTGADYIASWNGSSWSSLGGTTAINNIVLCLAIGPDGSLYAGGSFTNAGGVAAADGIAKWNGSAWSALGTGVNAGGVVYALAFGPDGTLYAGGDFTSMGGVANTARIAKWDGSAWSAMGTGAASNSVFALATVGTKVYAGGDFTNMGGVAAADGLAQWNGSAWSAMGTGASQVNALAVAPNGSLYIGGPFLTINGLSIPYLALWNGTSFVSVGTLDGDVNVIGIEASGIGHIGGLFTTINGITYPDRVAKFIGNSFSFESVDLPGTATVYAISPQPDGSLYLGYFAAGTATAAATTTITNTGTARAYPTLVIKGPSSGTARIFSVVNATTGRAIYLNLTISAGETVVMVFQPDNLSFTSDFQGNVAGSILGGSNEADFFLNPGANSIAFLSASSTVTATMQWRPAFASIDDVP